MHTKFDDILGGEDLRAGVANPWPVSHMKGTLTGFM